MPFDAKAIWIEPDAYYFADEGAIRRRLRFVTVMIFDRDGQDVTDMTFAVKHAKRLSRRRMCDLVEGPTPGDPTAVFVMACPL